MISAVLVLVGATTSAIPQLAQGIEKYGGKAAAKGTTHGDGFSSVRSYHVVTAVRDREYCYC
jgi:hypothetical protein